MSPDTLSEMTAIGLFVFALGLAVVNVILDGVRRHEARQFKRRQATAARRFTDACERGDTRDQHAAANDAFEVTTARLRREVGR